MKTSIKKLSMMAMFGLAMGSYVSCGEETLVQAISQRKSNDVIQQMIDAGADINAPDKDGSTPLSWAVATNNKKIIDKLIAAGANVNTENKFGGSVLESAISDDDEDLVEKLLAAGAKFNSASKINPMDLAPSYTMRSIVYDAKIKQSKEANEMLIDRLIAAGDNIDYRYLESAIASGNEALVKKLLAAGVKFDPKPKIYPMDLAKTDSMRTVVHEAMAQQRKDEAYRNSLKKD